MTWSFPLGRLLGSEIRVHVTFFVLLAWIGASAYADQGWQAAVENTLFVLALFTCVIAHEFGHALMARRYGIRTPDITLLPVGGLARLERMPEKPFQEIAVALAGPAVNVAIWAVLLLFGARTSISDMTQLASTGPGLMAQLAMVNLMLALFNMIPAFPMDGGRVLRALLCLVMDRVKATRVAAAAGQLVAVLLGYAGLSAGNPVLVLVAVFVFFAANAESQDVALRAVTRRMLARDAMITAFEPLAPDDTLDAATAAVIRTTQHEFPVLDRDGTLKGFVTRAQLFSALAGEESKLLPVASIMASDIPAVTLNAGLEAVLNHLHNGAPAVAVTTPHQQMVGYVTAENIGELMVIKGR